MRIYSGINESFSCKRPKVIFLHICHNFQSAAFCCLRAGLKGLYQPVIRQRLLLACALPSAPCWLYLGLLHGWVSGLLIWLRRAHCESSLRGSPASQTQFRPQKPIWPSVDVLRDFKTHGYSFFAQFIKVFFVCCFKQITEKEIHFFKEAPTVCFQ